MMIVIMKRTASGVRIKPPVLKKAKSPQTSYIFPGTVGFKIAVGMG